MMRIFNGIKTGWFIGIFISLVFSLLISDGKYHPVNPQSYMGQIYEDNLNELQIIALALLVWGAMGIMFALGDMIFSHTDMSVTKSTITHFSLTLLIFFPLAILAGWFPFTVESLMIFIIIFIIIYFTIWLIARFRNRHMVNEINKKLTRKK